MRYDILCVLLSMFVSIANFSPTTENECKRNAKAAEAIEKRLALSRYAKDLKRLVRCRNGELQLKPYKTHLSYFLSARMANFDENSGKLELSSIIYALWHDDHVTWNNNTQFGNVNLGYIADMTYLSMEAEDTLDEFGGNRGSCIRLYSGGVTCTYELLSTIRCRTDLTLWPYDRHTCIIAVTSWSFTTERLVFWNIPSTGSIYLFESDGEWNLSIARSTNEPRKSRFYDNAEYSQVTIEFVLDRLHSHLRRRFVAPAVIMMVMTLTALWLDTKSYERLAVSSLNVVIHMMCIQDLHWVLPRNGTTVPNMLLFYINSFVLATVALLLTFLLGKIEDIKTPAPKWISTNIDRVIASKAGHILLLCMLDHKIMTEITNGADDSSGLLSSEPKDFSWKYMAIFFGWLLFFSFFLTYIVMYILLIPNSASRPPIIRSY